MKQKNGKYIVKLNDNGDICSIIDKSKIGYDQLVLEIPEEAFLNVDDYVFETISMLRHKGVKIALIDFGVGYSSMSNLSEIEFDYAIVPKKLIMQIGYIQAFLHQHLIFENLHL